MCSLKRVSLSRIFFVHVYICIREGSWEKKRENNGAQVSEVRVSERWRSGHCWPTCSRSSTTSLENYRLFVYYITSSMVSPKVEGHITLYPKRHMGTLHYGDTLYMLVSYFTLNFADFFIFFSFFLSLSLSFIMLKLRVLFAIRTK